jgi:hypothetical protein
MFACDMKWLTVPVQPELISRLPFPNQQLILCMYINHLWNDHGIYHKRIRGNTIKSYIQEAAGLLALASGTRYTDVRKDDQTSTRMGQFILRMYNEIDWYESAKN